MKWRLLCAAALLTALVPMQSRAAGQVEVIVNQVGGLGGLVPYGPHPIELKFAIITNDAPERAAAVAMVAGGKVTGFTVANPGLGYMTTPAVLISGGGGSGAKATAMVNNGEITALQLVAAGTGYTSAPSVTIAPPPARLVVTTLWSNDGTSVAGSEPKSGVIVQIDQRRYSALLGYTGLPNMAPLPRAVLLNLDARVRVWYKFGSRFVQVRPDEPLHTVPYAEEASYAEIAGAVTAGAITNSMLSPGAITADKFAPGAVNNALPAALLASLSPNDPQLGALGYSKVQTFPGHDWVPSLDASAPSPRKRHTAIWTGTSMIVWGGAVMSGQLSNQGGEYAPAPKTWSLLTTANAPTPRGDHTAVWTGTKMLVWGGVTDAETGGTASGGIFNGSSKTWRATSATSAPSLRTQHTAVWCTDRMIVWGGNSPNGVRDDGGVFVPPLDSDSTGTGTWTSLPASNVAGVRLSHSAIWTGLKMIIWGGLDADANPLNTGAALNPANGTWTALPTLNAPSARFGHTALWTGGKMIVFGGADSELGGQIFNDGAIFDPATNAWTPLPALGAPEARLHHGVVWTGAEMLVFSGDGAGAALLLTAGAFNPATNSWRSLPSAPAGTTRLAGVWSGLGLLTFGLSGLDNLDPSPTLYLYGRF